MTIDIVSYDRINKVRKELLDKIEKSAFKGFIVDRDVFREEFNDANFESRWDYVEIDGEGGYTVENGKLNISNGFIILYKDIGYEQVKISLSFPSNGNIYGELTLVIAKRFDPIMWDYYSGAHIFLFFNINILIVEFWYYNNENFNYLVKTLTYPIDQNVRDYYIEVTCDSNVIKVKINDIVIEETTAMIISPNAFCIMTGTLESLMSYDYIYLKQYRVRDFYDPLIAVNNLLMSLPSPVVVNRNTVAYPGYIYLVDASDNSVNIIFSRAIGYKSGIVIVKKIDSSNNPVNLVADSEASIDVGSLSLTQQGQCAILTHYNNVWYVIGGYGL